MSLSADDRALFARGLRHAAETLSGEALDTALADLGWYDALAVDRRTAVTLLFEVQGRSGATSAALDAVLATALGSDPGTAVVLPPLGSCAPPGAGGRVAGLATCALERADLVLVGTDDGVVALHPEAVSAAPIAGLDPGLGLVAVTGELTRGTALPGRWADAVAAGQLALAHELVGASRAMLDLARAHALNRVQFDRPIARFQAVRHRLAESLVAIEAAADATGAAWWDPSPLAVPSAKAIAGRSARAVAQHCQQVLAGIGFTLEHPFHHHLRRALVLDRLLGDARSVTRAMGDELLRSRRLPPMLPL